MQPSFSTPITLHSLLCLCNVYNIIFEHFRSVTNISQETIQHGSAICRGASGLGGHGPVAGACKKVRGSAVYQALQQAQGNTKLVL